MYHPAERSKFEYQRIPAEYAAIDTHSIHEKLSITSVISFFIVCSGSVGSARGMFFAHEHDYSVTTGVEYRVAAE
jgi:hypothetical protein